MKKSKKDLLIDFYHSGAYRGARDIGELEQKFSAWMRRNNITLTTRGGRNYFDNDFYSSANYTVDLLKKDLDLLYAFGFDERHLVKIKPQYRDVTGEPYSLKNQFKHYGNQVHNAGQDANYRKNGARGFFGGGVGTVIIGIVILVLIYNLLGDTIYGFLTSGVPFKLICFAIGGFFSYKIIRSKTMGWPIYIKIIVLFVIWSVLLNYDF